MLTFQIYEATTKTIMSITVHRPTTYQEVSNAYHKQTWLFSKYNSISTTFKHYCCIKTVLSGNELNAIVPFHYRKSKCNSTYNMNQKSKPLTLSKLHQILTDFQKKSLTGSLSRIDH